MLRQYKRKDHTIHGTDDVKEDFRKLKKLLNTMEWGVLACQPADLYLKPNRSFHRLAGRDQVSSGTITLALAYGKAVVASPTIFAKEILSHKRGLLCKFDDARSIANCVKRILHESGLRQELETNASKYGQEVGWARAADQYGDVYRSAVSTHRLRDCRPLGMKPLVPS